MSLARYAILVAVFVALGLFTVWGHLRRVAVGYQESDLRIRKAKLEEEERALKLRIKAMTAPDAVKARVRDMGLDLRPPEEVFGVEAYGAGTPPRPASGGRASEEGVL